MFLLSSSLIFFFPGVLFFPPLSSWTGSRTGCWEPVGSIETFNVILGFANKLDLTSHSFFLCLLWFPPAIQRLGRAWLQPTFPHVWYERKRVLCPRWTADLSPGVSPPAHGDPFWAWLEQNQACAMDGCVDDWGYDTERRFPPTVQGIGEAEISHVSYSRWSDIMNEGFCELESKQINLVYNEMTMGIQFAGWLVWFITRASSLLLTCCFDKPVRFLKLRVCFSCFSGSNYLTFLMKKGEKKSINLQFFLWHATWN